MGRTALVNAINNEDLPMVKLLISAGVEAQDALLHAISKEFVEAVEFLLDHEESVTPPGQQHVRASQFFALFLRQGTKLMFIGNWPTLLVVISKTTV